TVAELAASAAVALRRAEVRRCFLITFALASVTHVCNVLVFFMLGHSLGLAVSLGQWFFVVPSALLLSMLPISAGGWGMREAGLIVALGGLGVPPEEAIVPSIIFGIGILLVALPGGIVWLASGRRLAAVEPSLEVSARRPLVASLALGAPAAASGVNSATHSGGGLVMAAQPS